MIWISQWLCPNRHCAIAIAWDDQEANPEEVESRGERVFQDRVLNRWCGICGQDLHVEHGRTRFATMEEALPHLRAIEKANLGTRVSLQNRALEEFFRIERFGGKEVLVGLADGKLAKGTRVRKVRTLPGDTHQDGALGTVVGALGPASDELKAELSRRGLEGVEWMYWVEWDDLPGVPVAIAENRIERVA